MKIPNSRVGVKLSFISLARIVSEDSQLEELAQWGYLKSSKDS